MKGLVHSFVMYQILEADLSETVEVLRNLN